jgi:probable F420-dependent oxidoreductase
MLPWTGPGGVLDPDGLVEVALAAEEAGYAGCTVTDHPLPKHGAERHTGLDPFAALTWVAAATRTLRLHTGVVVLPYRSPYVVAQAAATVQLLSAGRMILGLGAGYAAEEFAALDVDLAKRAALMDAGVDAIRAAWTGGPVTPAGNRSFPRLDGAAPPIWLGGNSRAARRRAVRVADGWGPFETPGTIAGAASLADLEELRAHVEDCRRLEAAAGREAPLTLSFVRPIPAWLERSDAAVREELAAIAALGVEWLVFVAGGGDAGEVAERARRVAALNGRAT